MSMYMVGYNAPVFSGKEKEKTKKPKKKKLDFVDIYKAFELMHKQDGTSQGKPKCDTYL